jgi:hypothetical protein
MLRAVQDGDRTIITSSRSIAAFNDLADDLIQNSSDEVAASRPTATDRMLNDYLSQFDPEVQPIILRFSSEDVREKFVNENGITYLGPNRALTAYWEMLKPLQIERRNAAPDQRTIGEILGIIEEDPTANLSDEEKAALKEKEAEGKKAYADAHKTGSISGESFSARRDSEASISDIKASVGPDGQLRIDSAIATKGLHSLTPQERRDALLKGAEEAAAKHEDYHTLASGERQSKRASDYVAAVVDRPDAPIVVIVPAVHWFRETTIERRSLTEALQGVLPEGLTEQPEAAVFASTGEFDAVVDAVGAAGFNLSLMLQRFYRNTVLGEDIAWKDEPEVPVEDANTNLDENGDDLMVTPDTSACDYFKTEVTGAKLDKMEDLLADAGVRRKTVYKKRDNTAGCWFVCTTLRFATSIEQVAQAAGFAVDTFQVDHRGDRLVAKMAGVKPIDRNATEDEKPRPWNDLVGEWKALSDEDREKNRKEWKGKEFLITGTDEHPRGLVVWICPETWFRKHECMFPERIDIKNLLPEYMEEIAPWTFRCTDETKDWNTVSFAIENKAQFKNSFLLAIHLNSLNA